MANAFDEKILGERQKIALAQKLRESGQEIPQGRMVGDRFVGASWTQGLAQALKQGLGAYQEAQAENKIKDLEGERTKGSIEALGSMGLQATPEMLKQAGTPEQSPEWTSRLSALIRGEDQPKAIPAQPYQQNVAQGVTPEQFDAGALKLMSYDPTMAAGAIGLSSNRAAREAAAAEKIYKHNQDKLQAEAKVEAVIEANKFTSSENDLNRQNQFAMHNDTIANRQAPQAPSWQTNTLANGDMVQIHPQTGEIRPLQGLKGKTSGDGSGMSTQSENKLIAINQQKTAVDSALKAIEMHPEAFSFARGAAEGLPFGETIAGRANTPDETETRSQVFNVVSSVIKERAGAAQSKGEKVTLERFLPSAGDKADQITAKFKAFKKHLDDQEKGIVDYYHPKDKTEVPIAPANTDPFAGFTPAQKAEYQRLHGG